MLSRVAVFVALLTASWCVMTFVHESGHVVCGWCGGGQLQEADLAPWGLPYSRFEPDPHPLLTLWGGPVIGAMLPLVIAAIAKQRWLWFIAYFCLLANGGYLATAWISGERFLDTPRLLHHGAHPATIAAFCVVTISAGYYGFRKECTHLLSADKRIQPDGSSHAEPGVGADSR
jgi:hypothetical protein